jgi:hypothetical protein
MMCLPLTHRRNGPPWSRTAANAHNKGTIIPENYVYRIKHGLELKKVKLLL